MSRDDEREHGNREAYREELKREARAWTAALATCEDVDLDEILDDRCPDCGEGPCVCDRGRREDGGEA